MADGMLAYPFLESAETSSRRNELRICYQTCRKHQDIFKTFSTGSGASVTPCYQNIVRHEGTVRRPAGVGYWSAPAASSVPTCAESPAFPLSVRHGAADADWIPEDLA